jgi:hypothetical protein
MLIPFGTLASSGLRGDGAIVTSNLVLNVDAGNTSSYSGSGTTWFDISGNAYNGTLNNGPTFSTDGTGSIQLDGVNDMITFPNNSVFVGVAFSVEFWVKRLGNGLGDYIWVINNADDPENRLLMTSTQWNPIVYDNGAYQWQPSIEGASNNTWYHAVMTVRNGAQRLYVNGTLIGSATGSYSGGSGVQQHEIGNYSRVLNRNFYGRIGSYRFYNKELSGSEVTQNFEARRWRYGV